VTSKVASLAGIGVMAVVAGVLVCASQSAVDKPVRATPVDGYKVVRSYPHDRHSFTQGLEYREGVLYEGTGLPGQSALRRIKLETGEVLQNVSLAPEYHGEGITVIGDSIVQLTWRHNTGFVYDKKTFGLQRRFQYPGEGWGLANDGERIYMSDGTSQIRVWTPGSFQEQRRIAVRDGGRSISYLNELEWIRGEIWANVWQTDRVARISPLDGHVIGWIDFSGLLSRSDLAEPVDVLNGIAYDPAKNRIFVTGKLWPKLFEVKVLPSKR
jgi:glutamine cyclotransferase